MTEMVELYVVMHCEACAAIVERAIKKIPGVESYTIDLYGQKVTVIGEVDQGDVWQRIHKTGKRVTLIPKPAPAKAKKASEKKENKEKREEKKEDKKEVKVKKEGKTQEKKARSKVVNSPKPILVQKKSTYRPGVWLWRFFNPREVKVHGKKKEGVTVGKVETEKKEDNNDEESSDGKEETEKEENSDKEPEWVPMFVCAPFYTLPTEVLLLP